MENKMFFKISFILSLSFLVVSENLSATVKSVKFNDQTGKNLHNCTVQFWPKGKDSAATNKDVSFGKEIQYESNKFKKLNIDCYGDDEAYEGVVKMPFNPSYDITLPKETCNPKCTPSPCPYEYCPLKLV